MDKVIFWAFIVGLILFYIGTCLLWDGIEKSIKARKKQLSEIEKLRKQNHHLKAVIETYEAWNLKI